MRKNHYRSMLFIPSLIVTLLASINTAYTKYDPAKNYIQSEQILQHYPEPDIVINTPAFVAGKADFTSQQEMENYIQQLSKQSDKLRVLSLGKSQKGHNIPLLIFADPPVASGSALVKNNKPTVLMIGLQHGNEPAGGEATLAYAERLASTDESKILEKVNIIIVPRANPDGAEDFKRDLADGFNLNRDHLLLTTPEGKALAWVFNQYQPDVVLDSHEFTVAARWIDKFGGLQRSDGEIQYSTIANEPQALRDISENLFRQALIKDFDEKGINYSWYYTTSANDVNDKKVSMGGIGPDTGRNIAGLRNSVSFLLETRGIGLGKESFKRRVYTHLVAIQSIVETTANNAQKILETNAQLRKDVADLAGKGEIVVTGAASAEKNKIKLVDVESGKIKEVDVDWMNSLVIKPILTRSRPYGYILPASEVDTAYRLQLLGLDVFKVKEPVQLNVEMYRVTSSSANKKHDVTGSVGQAGGDIIQLTTEVITQPITMDDSYFYVPLNQPLANLAVAALEPESQSSYVANHLMTLPENKGDTPAILPVYRLTTKAALPLVLLDEQVKNK